MHTLAAIIIERIKDIHRIKKLQSKINTLPDQDQQLINLDQKMAKNITQVQKKQSIRITTQLTTINDLRNQTLTSEDNMSKFLAASMGVFRTYSPTFQQRFQTKDKQSIASKLHRLYKQFLSTHANTFHFAHIYSCLKKDIVDVNPVIYLGWIGQWSRGLLAQTTKKQISSNQTLKLRAQLNRITGNKIAQQKGAQLVLYTRQNFYGYFLPELEQYYKKLQLLNLDLQYLHSIKQMGHKQQLIGKNTNQSIQFIINKANSTTACLTQKFCEEYCTHFIKKTQRKSRYSSLKNHRLNKIKPVQPNPQKRQTQQYNIEKDLLLQQNQPPKQSKVLLKACKKIQFPIIAGINNNRKLAAISPSKIKQPFHFKTQQKETVLPIKIERDDSLIDLKPNKNNRLSHEVKLELILAQNQYRNQHQSIIRKLRHKGFSVNSRQKTQKNSPTNFNYQIFELNRQQNYFMSQKKHK